ncbi:MAG: threonylcarbamoyl-AMP synthase [Bacteroidetes bacterium GWF2_38_335]|nr:MAG: threonylcarbamoyl-AMP synthase [Bacteroidetes bacterium GWF2_38_335]OFY79054.1 MAG: threonylcarbamoyl-AMP synthase [Bacteroidetes bacterium RIFOXYA12_FULL_38_20]HBS86136.1 threonylcarbamoyl-AMP synthase [Bacteroidales bacterium]
MNQDIENSLKVLRKGGIILYPTDTIWGIGCDATNSAAVKKIIDLKKRNLNKSMLILLDHIDNLGRYVKEIPEMAIELLAATEEPVTIIYPGAINLAPQLIAADGSIGIRITNDDFCRNLIFKLGRPLVSTSANIEGKLTPGFFDQIDEEIINGVDYVVEHRQTDKMPRKPSEIIRIGLKGEVQIIRK